MGVLFTCLLPCVEARCILGCVGGEFVAAAVLVAGKEHLGRVHIGLILAVLLPVEDPFYKAGEGQHGADGAERQVFQENAADHGGCRKEHEGQHIQDDGAAAERGETVELAAVARGLLQQPVLRNAAERRRAVRRGGRIGRRGRDGHGAYSADARLQLLQRFARGQLCRAGLRPGEAVVRIDEGGLRVGLLLQFLLVL